MIAFQRGEFNANKDGITGTNWMEPVHDRLGNMTTIPEPANLAGGLTATYDAWKRLVELKDGHGDLTNRHLHGPAVDQILADEQVDSLAAPGEVLWPLTDNLGTVRDLAVYDDATGITAIVNHLTYSAFGEITDQTDPTVNHRFAFTGREWDEDAGLYYYRARWYDPELGRFLSEDPIGFGAGDANLNRYVGNAPTNMLDASGLKTRRIKADAEQLKAIIEGYLGNGVFLPLVSSLVARDLIADSRGRHRIEDGKLLGCTVVSSFAEVVNAYKKANASNNRITVLELTGHVNQRTGNMEFGHDKLTRANAAHFASRLRQHVSQDRKKGLIILMGCNMGTFAEREDPHGMAQIIANETGWDVLSPGGLVVGTFGFFFNRPPYRAQLPRVRDGSNIEVYRWHLTTPDAPGPTPSVPSSRRPARQGAELPGVTERNNPTNEYSRING